MYNIHYFTLFFYGKLWEIHSEISVPSKLYRTDLTTAPSKFTEKSLLSRNSVKLSLAKSSREIRSGTHFWFLEIPTFPDSWNFVDLLRHLCKTIVYFILLHTRDSAFTLEGTQAIERPLVGVEKIASGTCQPFNKHFHDGYCHTVHAWFCREVSIIQKNDAWRWWFRLVWFEIRY